MKFSRISLPLLLLVLVLAGCGQGSSPTSPTGDSGADQSAVEQELALHPELVDDEGISSSADAIEADAEASALLSGSIGRPLRFWRHIRSIERRFEIAFADSDSTGRPVTAHAKVHVFLAGTFNVAVGDSGEIDSVVHKPLRDHAVRRVLLKRMRLPGARHDGWKIVATSGIQVTSRDAETEIVSLRVQSGGLDTTITEPLALFRLRAILKVAAGESTTLTVTTSKNDDVVLLYTRLGRFPFHNNGDGTYSGTWRAPLFEGFRHFGVNALSHGSLFDPAAPYDSKAWILPYRVVDKDPGEYAI